MSELNLLPPGTTINLTNCDREPIHVPGSIQPHGAMLVLRLPELTITQVSANSESFLGYTVDQLLDQPLSMVLDQSVIGHLKNAILTEHLDTNPLYIFTIHVANHNRLCDGIAHISDGMLVLEFELEFEPVLPRMSLSPADPYRAVRTVLPRIYHTPTLAAFCQAVAEQVRILTNFERVMVYRFQPDESGVVIAESCAEGIESFLGLHYPASDIPRQARALYLRNWLRLIPDVPYTPVPLVTRAENKHLIDMTHATLRSVSPMHIEYLINMGVRASMSISLVTDGALWGLIACHNVSEPRYVAYDVRTACEFLGQVASAQLAAKEQNEDYEYRVHLQAVQTNLVKLMSSGDDFAEALTHFTPNLLDVVQAEGAALLFNGECRLLGATPTEAQVRALAEWITRSSDTELFATASLSQHYPQAAAYTEVASGVLAITISRTRHDCLLWFRPEEIQTVTWGGDPNKPVEATDDELRLSPRKSFAAWREQVRATSLPWKDSELEAVHELLSAIMLVVLRKAEELMRLNADLERSNAELDAFAYIASHDLKEPLRGIHNYASFLIEDYEDKLDKEGVMRLHTLIRLTQRMEALIEALLYYSRVGRVDLSVCMTNLDEVLQHTLELLRPRIEELGVQVRIPRPLPTIYCDRVRVGEVFNNLITNAIKYNDKPEPMVEIGYLDASVSDEQAAEIQPLVLYVRDNGIGIQEKHFDIIFRIFKRLHGRNEYGGGTGAGLTITRKIIERHGGRIWVESQHEQGTTFFFTLQSLSSAFDDRNKVLA